MYKKAQTATEYLIILAVVIVVALIVVEVMGGIPGVGKAKEQPDVVAEVDISTDEYQAMKDACENMKPLEVYDKLQGFRDGVKFDIVDTDYKTEFMPYSGTCGIKANLCVEEYAGARLCYQVFMKI